MCLMKEHEREPESSKGAVCSALPTDFRRRSNNRRFIEGYLKFDWTLESTVANNTFQEEINQI